MRQLSEAVTPQFLKDTTTGGSAGTIDVAANDNETHVLKLLNVTLDAAPGAALTLTVTTGTDADPTTTTLLTLFITTAVNEPFVFANGLHGAEGEAMRINLTTDAADMKLSATVL